MKNSIALFAAAAALLTLPACPFGGDCGDNHEPLVAGAYEFASRTLPIENIDIGYY
ncbi:MAG: hypothetical protein ACJAYU_001026 [Bradymonadia bacterium]|jgi:hypothetical protein